MKTAGEILAGAADYLEQNTWVQGKLHIRNGSCAIGALIRACHDDYPATRTFGVAVWAVEMEIGRGISISAWNDEPGRDKAEVIATLRNAKRHLPADDA